MRNKRIIWAAAAIAVVMLLTGAGIALALTSRADPPGAAPGANGPAAAPTSTSPEPPLGADITGPLDLLIVGVDTRTSIPDWEPHADALMLLHVEEGLDSGYLYSLPRDLRVDIPAFPKADFAGGRYKITEAMSRGSRVPGSKKPSAEQGYELLSRTVADYTGIDEFQAGAVLNFAGLSRLTDQLGGVRLKIDQKVVSIHRRPDGTMRTMRAGGGGYIGPQAIYRPGTRTLKGWQAIDYARQRYTAGGDYTRQRHQRQLVKALLTKAEKVDLATNEAYLQTVLSALGDTLIYVGGRSPIEYAYALRNLKPENLTLVGLPGESVTSGGAYIGEELQPEGERFLEAVVEDRVAAYLTDHPKLVNKS